MTICCLWTDCAGLAIVGVVWHHLTYWLIKPAPGVALSPVLLVFPQLTCGWQGVNLFFFLSGFVLALPYLSGRRTMGSLAEIGQFYKRRAMRLLPLFYIVCLCSFVFLENDYAPKRILGLLATFSLLFNFSPRTFSPAVNWVFWSIGVEIWFSVIFPLMLIAYSRFKGFALILAVIAISVSVRAVGYRIYPHADTALHNYISDSVVGRLDDFALGMAACHLFLTRRAMLAKRRYLLVSLGYAIACYASMLLWNFRHRGRTAQFRRAVPRQPDPTSASWRCFWG